MTWYTNGGSLAIITALSARSFRAFAKLYQTGFKR